MDSISNPVKLNHKNSLLQLKFYLIITITIPESQDPALLNVVPLSEEMCKEIHPVSYNSGEMQWPLSSPSTYPAVFVLSSNLTVKRNNDQLIFLNCFQLSIWIKLTILSKRKKEKQEVVEECPTYKQCASSC